MHFFLNFRKVLLTIFDFLDLFHELLKKNRTAKQFQQVTDTLMLVIAVFSFAIPLIMSGVIFFEVCPENYMIRSVFEVDLDMSWKFILFPIVFGYGLMNSGDLIFIIDMAGVLHMHCSAFWLAYLTPESIKVDNTGDILFRCRLGCMMKADQLLLFYRANTILTRTWNDIIAHPLTTAHHKAFLYLTVLGLFICIRHWNKLLLPGFQMAILSPVICLVAEYIEATFVMAMKEKSEQLLKRVGTLAKQEQQRTVNIRASLKGMFPLETLLAYPVYKLNKQNFLRFQNETINLLVDMLVSL